MRAGASSIIFTLIGGAQHNSASISERTELAQLTDKIECVLGNWAAPYFAEAVFRMPSPQRPCRASHSSAQDERSANRVLLDHRNAAIMTEKESGQGGNLAVVITEFNKENPTAGLKIVKREKPKPKAGEPNLWAMQDPD